MIIDPGSKVDRGLHQLVTWIRHLLASNEAVQLSPFRAFTVQSVRSFARLTYLHLQAGTSVAGTLLCLSRFRQSAFADLLDLRSDLFPPITISFHLVMLHAPMHVVVHDF